MTLREARCRWTTYWAQLIQKGQELGYQVAGDETMIHSGVGHMDGSLHYQGCAGDLLLYDKDGNYLTDGDSYKPLGEYWKSLDQDNAWGGDFQIRDYDHFSFAPSSLFGTRK